MQRSAQFSGDEASGSASERTLKRARLREASDAESSSEPVRGAAESPEANPLLTGAPLPVHINVSNAESPPAPSGGAGSQGAGGSSASGTPASSPREGSGSPPAADVAAESGQPQRLPFNLEAVISYASDALRRHLAAPNPNVNVDVDSFRLFIAVASGTESIASSSPGASSAPAQSSSQSQSSSSSSSRPLRLQQLSPYAALGGALQLEVEGSKPSCKKLAQVLRGQYNFGEPIKSAFLLAAWQNQVGNLFKLEPVPGGLSRAYMRGDAFVPKSPKPLEGEESPADAVESIDISGDGVATFDFRVRFNYPKRRFRLVVVGETPAKETRVFCSHYALVAMTGSRALADQKKKTQAAGPDAGQSSSAPLPSAAAAPAAAAAAPVASAAATASAISALHGQTSTLQPLPQAFQRPPDIVLPHPDIPTAGTDHDISSSLPGPPDPLSYLAHFRSTPERDASGP
eukprot:tig00000455_g1002.t2